MSDSDSSDNDVDSTAASSISLQSQADNDVDSTFGSSSSPQTESVGSSIYQYPVEYGKRYHAYRKGKYFLPNDNAEQARLDLQAQAMRLATGDYQFHAPVHRMGRVLDLGTGTGQWAIEMGDLFGDEVEIIIGIDLSPIQPTWVPPNVKFEVDDVEEDWTFHEGFDFIHSRCMVCGSIADRQRYFEQAYK
jgi:SAM-dependent methyltransferase